MSTRSRKTRLLELDQPERESIIVDATGELLPIDTDNEDFSRLLVDADGENILQPDGLVTEYEQYCRRRASDHIESGRPDLSTSWKQEADAWALVRILLSERYGTDEDVDESGNPVQRGPLNTLCSDFGHSYEVSKGVREHIIVKQWLESIAPDFQPVEVRKGYYPHTNVQIRNQKRLQGVSTSWAIGEDQVVSELDPDAPTRQNRRMAPEDQSYETELLRTIYEYLRRGRLSDAFHLCAACDQPWRIASLGGGAFRDDPFVDGFKDFDGEQFHGNENRMLWKAVCYQIALDENAHPYERAIYGVLSGDVKNALSACHSWEDHIWVRYHAMIEALTSKALCDMPKPFAFDQEISLPLPNVDLEPHTIFTDLSKSEDARISREASEPFHIIQAHLILNSLDVLFASLSAQLIEMEQNLDTPAIAGLPRVLRFSAHLILLLREMGVVEVAEHSHHVHFLLRKYIEMLMVAGKGDLIAMYIAFLPSEMQVDCYSSFLQDVNEDLETRYALAMAGTASVCAGRSPYIPAKGPLRPHAVSPSATSWLLRRRRLPPPVLPARPSRARPRFLILCVRVPSSLLTLYDFTGWHRPSSEPCSVAPAPRAALPGYMSLPLLGFCRTELSPSPMVALCFRTRRLIATITLGRQGIDSLRREIRSAAALSLDWLEISTLMS
ncbi:hypothetical protein BASA62_001874 [Batrachochytrium salamandrivorans]|nr:hypothetical protein BASA62_001874 [Batrachochytrium salamandrivorans]